MRGVKAPSRGVYCTLSGFATGPVAATRGLIEPIDLDEAVQRATHRGPGSWVSPFAITMTWSIGLTDRA